MYPIDRSATIRPFKRPVPVPPTSDKFKARMARQRMLEYEQQMEDLEALKVTPEDLQLLQESFATVKAEFMDLDGLSWDSPAARDMLYQWHVQQATRERPVHMSPGGVRMRHQQPRRSLAAVVSPSPSIEILSSQPGEEEDDASLDEILRGRSIAARIGLMADKEPAFRPKSIPMRRTGTMVSAEEDDDDGDISAPVAPPGLAPPSRPTAGFLLPDSSTKQRLYKHLAQLAASNTPLSGRSATTSSSSVPAITSAGRSASRTVLIPASPVRERTASGLGKGKAISSISPMLKHCTTFSDSDTLPAYPGSVPMQRLSCSTTTATSDMDREEVETVLREYLLRTQVGPTGSASLQAISTTTGLRPSTVSRLAPSTATTPRRPRGRTIISHEGPKIPTSYSHGALLRKSPLDHAADDEDGDGSFDMPDLVRTMSCMGWSPSGKD